MSTKLGSRRYFHRDDVAAWLSHHGVSASELVAEKDEDRNATGQLDGIAADVGAGLEHRARHRLSGWQAHAQPT